MGTELLNQLPVSAAHHAPPAVAPDPDFDPRWAAWIARGRAHDRRVQRFVTWAFGLSMGAAIVYAFLR